MKMGITLARRGGLLALTRAQVVLVRGLNSLYMITCDLFIYFIFIFF